MRIHTSQPFIWWWLKKDVSILITYDNPILIKHYAKMDAKIEKSWAKKNLFSTIKTGQGKKIPYRLDEVKALMYLDAVLKHEEAADRY